MKERIGGDVMDKITKEIIKIEREEKVRMEMIMRGEESDDKKCKRAKINYENEGVIEQNVAGAGGENRVISDGMRGTKRKQNANRERQSRNRPDPFR